MLGAAVARNEDALAGGLTAFVGDGIARLIRLDYIFKGLVFGKLSDADKGAFAVDIDLLVGFFIFKTQCFEFVIGDKLL